MSQPIVILDDAAHGRARAFGRPLGEIRAQTPEEVPAALAAIETVREMGLYTAGYFSYELGYALEPRLLPLMPRHRAVPLLWFGVFDAPEKIELGHLDAALEEWCTGRAFAGPLKHEWNLEDYHTRFARARELIAAGDIYQVNLTFRSRFRFRGDPLAYYRSLRALSAAPYGAYVNDGQRQILSLSPELFFDLSPNGVLIARPMKGTAARMHGRDEDAEAREALFRSTKDRAENLMIVDLLRNDISRISQIGSVEVADLFAVETYPTLHQMVSTISAQIMANRSVGDIVRALFPCGSVTGAPKIRAMEIVAELENHPRGIYCGAIGHFGPDGEARFNVAIRTLTISGTHGALGIGGAVVQDSILESEYAECLLKARYMEAARRPLELIETLRYSPEDGFVRMTLHMKRMLHAASAFAIRFDEEAAARVLEEAVHGAKSELRVRLTLSEAGVFACSASPMPPPVKAWTYAVSPKRVAESDPFARYKTNSRELYEKEFVRIAKAIGCDEVIFLNRLGEVAEGSHSNVFVVRAGKLVTPPLESGALDGCLRRELIEQGHCTEAVLTEEDLDGLVYLGNSLRGLIRAVPAV